MTVLNEFANDTLSNVMDLVGEYANSTLISEMPDGKLKNETTPVCRVIDSRFLSFLYLFNAHIQKVNHIDIHFARDNIQSTKSLGMC